MADNYEDYTCEQLVRLLRERDKRPRFHLYGVSVASDQSFHFCMTTLCSLLSTRNPNPNVVMQLDLKGDRFATIATTRVRCMTASLGQERVFAESG
jgi:hypothetical protein